MNEFVRVKEVAVLAARVVVNKVICPVEALSVTPVVLLVAWLTTPPVV